MVVSASEIYESRERDGVEGEGAREVGLAAEPIEGALVGMLGVWKAS